VAGEILAGVRPAGDALLSVVESGAVVNVGGGVGTPGEDDVAAQVERVALVMVERAKVGFDVGDRIGRADVGIVQSPGDDATGLGDLIGVSEMKLAAAGDAGRAQRQFPSANQGSGIG